MHACQNRFALPLCIEIFELGFAETYINVVKLLLLFHTCILTSDAIGSFTEFAGVPFSFFKVELSKSVNVNYIVENISDPLAVPSW